MKNTMTVISSQKYRNAETVEEKIEMLKQNGIQSVEIPVVNAYTKDFDENDLYIVVDHHHTLSAAIALGINIEFVEVEDTHSYYKDIEEQNGEAILEANYLDDAWYYIDLDEEDGIGGDVW